MDITFGSISFLYDGSVTALEAAVELSSDFDTVTTGQVFIDINNEPDLILEWECPYVLDIESMDVV